MTDVARQDYPDRDTLMRGLAELVADQLRAAHATKHRATLAVPGGTTPGPFLAALSEAELAWSEVDVLPTDERMVPELSPRSNARLIRETLLRNAAAEATLVHYHPAGARLDLVLRATCERVAKVLPIDVLVLGMGADMHTASLFPGADNLAAALAADAPPVMAMVQPATGEARVSLTAPVLAGAMSIHILITGEEKRAAVEKAAHLDPIDAPIAAVLSGATVHWAP